MLMDKMSQLSPCLLTMLVNVQILRDCFLSVAQCTHRNMFQEFGNKLAMKKFKFAIKLPVRAGSSERLR